MLQNEFDLASLTDYGFNSELLFSTPKNLLYPNSSKTQRFTISSASGDDHKQPPSHSGQDEERGQGQTLVQTRPLTKEPSLYKVILLNDDYTPMEFVTLILKKFFKKSDAEAEQIMLEVHHKGAGLAGIYSFEVAETKVYQVQTFSRTHQHPLKCKLEREEA